MVSALAAGMALLGRRPASNDAAVKRAVKNFAEISQVVKDHTSKIADLRRDLGRVEADMGVLLSHRDHVRRRHERIDLKEMAREAAAREAAREGTR